MIVTRNDNKDIVANVRNAYINEDDRADFEKVFRKEQNVTYFYIQKRKENYYSR